MKALKWLGRLLAVLAAVGLVVHFAISAYNDDETVEKDPGNPAWLDKSLYPFQHRYAEIDGNRVHYVDEGTGPVFVFFHGNPTWSFLYRKFVAGLMGHYRCIAVDYPGFGLSTARAGYGFTPGEHSAVIEKLLVQLGVKDAIFMVQDWGGPVGLGLAGRRPEMVKGLVIGNTWAWPADAPGLRRFSSIMGGSFGGLLVNHYNLFVNGLIPAGIKRRRLTDAEMAAYRGPFRSRASREPVHIFPAQIVAAREYLTQVRDNLAALKDRPVLIVWGDSDQAFHAEDRERFEAMFPKHETIVLEGAAHYIQEDAPEEILPALVKFGARVFAAAPEPAIAQ